MSAPKHTPGPWEAGQTDRVLTGPHKERFADWYVLAPRSEDDEEGGSIASIWAKDFGADAEANAHLIAAAPDLLEALKGVAKWCHSGHGTYPAKQCGLCAPVLEAIAAAEGRDQ